MRLVPLGKTWDEVHGAFRWNLPERFNIAEVVCDRWADDHDRVALIYEGPDHDVRTFTFRDMQALANRFANAARTAGLKPGDRVLILLGQTPETAAAHLGCWKSGLISIPSSVLFGPDALAYRVEAAGVSLVITDTANAAKFAGLRDSLPSLKVVWTIDGAIDGTEDFHDHLFAADSSFTTLASGPRDPALMLFTSGTTGNPKAALHGHGILLNHVAGIEFSLNGFPQDGDVMWSPADWAWIAGLLVVLMPAWYHGVPVVAHRPAGRFDAEAAYALMGRHRVSVALLVPTMLKMMRNLPGAAARHGVRLRVINSGGESLGAETMTWAQQELGCPVNEIYGQTECNLVLGNCSTVLEPRPGSLGKALPGHTVAIIDDKGRELGVDELGHIAVRRPDPAMMLEYWGRPDATADKYIGDWLITGDLGTRDADGYFWYRGRSDDVITSAGYRIGPGEIEDALIRHPAVALAAAIGVPDPVRTETVKAFLVLRPGFEPTDALAGEISAFVRHHLAAHEYPREIAFVTDLPMTTTGKVMRRSLREQEAERRAAAQG